MLIFSALFTFKDSREIDPPYMMGYTELDGSSLNYVYMN